MMKSLICNAPRQFAYAQKNIPVPATGEALLKVRKIGICGTDLHAFDGTQPYFTYPRILGHELAAKVEETGGAQAISRDEMVTLIPYFNCGQCHACRSGKPNCCVTLKVFGVHIDGGMQEYITVPSHALVSAEGLDEDSLALIEPLSVGAHAVRRADVKPGEFALVIGAGPIGLGVMEFVRIAGGNVIALDVNAQRLTFCREKLKVDYALNAMGENVLEQIQDITSGEMPSVIFDATGSLNAINNGFSYMSHGGRYVLVGLQKGNISISHPEFHKREGTLMSSRNATRKDFEHVISSMKKGEVDPTTYITHRVIFDNIKDEFANWLNPANGVIKAMVTVD